MRRQFILPEADLEYLESSGYQWEAAQSAGNLIVIHGYQVPEGYNHKEVTLAFKVPGGYPTAQLDMVYIFPKLARIDGRGVNALSDTQFDGKVWQQWSRHRTAANPWRPGVDGIMTQLILVNEWLLREFNPR